MVDSWETVELTGHDIDVFTPAEARKDAALLLLMSGEQRAAESQALAKVLRQLQLPVISPRDTNCWWLDRVETTFDESLEPLTFLNDSVLPFLAERFGVAPPGVKLLGNEVGGQGVLQLAFRRPREFPAVAAINGAIDFHEIHGMGSSIDELFPNREAARQQTATLRLHPAAWPRRMMLIADRESYWFGGSDRLDMKLRSMGIPIETEFEATTDGDGWKFFEEQVERAISFLLKERMTFPVVQP